MTDLNSASKVFKIKKAARLLNLCKGDAKIFLNRRFSKKVFNNFSYKTRDHEQTKGPSEAGTEETTRGGA
jgi:hypothetical protein